MKTTLLIAALIIFLQADSCQKKREQKSPAISPTPVESVTKSPTPHRTTDAPSGGSLDPGVWGGRGVSLQITAAGAEVEFDCAHGTLEQRIISDAEGRFEVTGTFITEGGPVRIPVDGAAPKGSPATYRGRIAGEQMTLDVTVAGTGAKLMGLSLVRGRPPSLRKCY